MLDFNDFMKLVKAMKSIWVKDDFLPDEYSIKLWYSMLKDIPYEQLNLAIQKYAYSNKFPPSISDLRNNHVEIVSPTSSEDWGRAWELTLRAIRKFGRDNEGDALASMDEITRMVVKRMGWKSLCNSEDINTDRANFRMIYAQVQATRKESYRMPDSLKNAIENVSGKALPEESKQMQIEHIQPIEEEQQEVDEQKIPPALRERMEEILRRVQT